MRYKTEQMVLLLNYLEAGTEFSLLSAPTVGYSPKLPKNVLVAVLSPLVRSREVLIEQVLLVTTVSACHAHWHSLPTVS